MVFSIFPSAVAVVPIARSSSSVELAAYGSITELWDYEWREEFDLLDLIEVKAWNINVPHSCLNKCLKKIVQFFFGKIFHGFYCCDCF